MAKKQRRATGTTSKTRQKKKVKKKRLLEDVKESQEQGPPEEIEKSESDDAISLTYIGTRITTPDELVAECDIDMSVWEIERVVINSYEVAGKRNLGQRYDAQSGQLKWMPQTLWKTGLRQIKVWLRRKSDERMAIEWLLAELERKSPVRP